MYWWSNTAVPECKGARIAVPASEAYVQVADFVTRKTFPNQDGLDVSYPMHTTSQRDYFYALQDKSRKYQGYILSDGTGLIQASTSRLQGRKLFVWGQNAGSKSWQQFLTKEAGSYVEIQAGLGPTQYGCVPMQPNGTWEFAEVYGSISIDSDAQKADYPIFLSAVEKALEQALPARQLEEWLLATSDSIGRRYVPANCYGGGDAALENALRKATGQRTLNPVLDFGKTEIRHSDFEHLLTYGYMPMHDKDYIPAAFVSGRHWCKQLETAVNGPDRDNWLTLYHLGLVLMDEANKAQPHIRSKVNEHALSALRRSADLCANAPVLYALAEALVSVGATEEAAACAVKSCRLFGGDLSVAKATMRLLVSLKASKFTLALYDDLPEDVQMDERIQFWRTSALVFLDRFDEALAILQQPGYILTDFREGEESVSELWDKIVRHSGRTDLKLPAHLNFNAIQTESN